MFEEPTEQEPPLLSRIGSFALIVSEVALAYVLIGLFVDYDDVAAKLAEPLSWHAVGNFGIIAAVWLVVMGTIFFGVEFLRLKIRRLRKS